VSTTSKKKPTKPAPLHEPLRSAPRHEPLHKPLRDGDRIIDRGLLLSDVSCWEPDCPGDHVLSGDLDLYIAWDNERVEVHPYFVAINANIIRECDINEAFPRRASAGFSTGSAR